MCFLGHTWGLKPPFAACCSQLAFCKQKPLCNLPNPFTKLYLVCMLLRYVWSFRS